MALGGRTSSSTPTSSVSGTPRARKHRVSDDATTTRHNLKQAKKSVVKELKKVQSQQRAEAKATQRLVMKAQRLTLEQLVAIVDMKTEVPDIVCSHCSRGLKTGPELRKALRETEAGARLRECNHLGKPLADE
jgi:hypothetical protein